MKRFLLVGALSLAALASVGAAAAAPAATHTLRGTVVAKDSSRRALVVALAGGKVQTVVATAAFRRSDVGRRVVIGYTLVPGTFAVARSVTLRSLVHRARVKGTVVRLRNHDAVISAGGSLLDVALLVTKHRTPAGFAPIPRAGDSVTVDVQIGDDDSLEATEVEVEDAPQGQPGAGASEGEMRVHGKVKGPLSPTALTVTTGTGVDVTCAIPTGVTLKFQAGDSIELECDLVAGIWTVRVGGHDGGNHVGGNESHGGKGKAEGLITLLTETQIQVTPQQGDPVTCAVPTEISSALIAKFKLQDQVELKCTTVAGVLTVHGIEGHDSSGEEQGTSSGHSSDANGGQGGNSDQGGGDDGPSDD